MQRPSLREKLELGEFVTAPGVFDMLSALIADSVGFDFVYASGFWLTASNLGLPDAGIATYTQMLDRVTALAHTTKAGIIADADTGYGRLLNVHHTVRGYEAAGVTAIQIEDQVFPKKCGHTPNKSVVPSEDMEIEDDALRRRLVGREIELGEQPFHGRLVDADLVIAGLVLLGHPFQSLQR